MIGDDGPFYIDCADRKCLRQANQVKENHWNAFCYRRAGIISRVGRWYKLHTLGVLDRISLIVIGDALLRAFIGHTSISHTRRRVKFYVTLKTKVFDNFKACTVCVCTSTVRCRCLRRVTVYSGKESNWRRAKRAPLDPVS